MEDGAVPKQLTTSPSNLPLQLNRFIGRERELSVVRDLFLTTRLLTLAGAGGNGLGRLCAAGELLGAPFRATVIRQLP
jgi:hypothetical protein